jgi:hypothetical protein
MTCPASALFEKMISSNVTKPINLSKLADRLGGFTPRQLIGHIRPRPPQRKGSNDN